MVLIEMSLALKVEGWRQARFLILQISNYSYSFHSPVGICFCYFQDKFVKVLKGVKVLMNKQTWFIFIVKYYNKNYSIL